MHWNEKVEIARAIKCATGLEAYPSSSDAYIAFCVDGLRILFWVVPAGGLGSLTASGRAISIESPQYQAILDGRLDAKLYLALRKMSLKHDAALEVSILNE